MSEIPDGYAPGGDGWATDPATHVPVDDEWFPVDQVVADAGPPVVPPTWWQRMKDAFR
jgi:hypothetical protein